MVLDLVDKGCVPNKEQILQWPSDNTVSDYLKRHFLRGYIDGDGCNYLGKNMNGSRSMVSLSSSLGFCSGAQEWLMEKCNLNKTKIPFHDGIYNLRYGGKRQVSRIFHLIYDNALVWLSRKRVKLEKIVYSMEYLKNTEHKRIRGLSKEEEQEIINDYNNLLTLPKIQAKWNVCGTTIRMVLMRNGIARNRIQKTT